jgi:hypothetical protein
MRTAVTRPRQVIGADTSLSADHVEQGTFTSDGEKPGKLGHVPLICRAWLGSIEEARRCLAAAAQYARRTVEILNVVFGEPAQHFVDGVPRLMRVEILVLDPDIGLSCIVDAVAHHIVDLRSEHANEFRAQPRRKASRPIVEAHHYDTAGLGFPYDVRKSGPGIERVMKDAVGDHDIETGIFDGEVKDIHLAEAGPLQMVALLVFQREAQAAKAEVDAQDVVVVKLEEVTELTSAAATFQNQLVVANGVEQLHGEGVLVSLVHKLAELL